MKEWHWELAGGGDSAPLCVYLFNIFDSLSSVLQVNMSPLFKAVEHPLAIPPFYCCLAAAKSERGRQWGHFWISRKKKKEEKTEQERVCDASRCVLVKAPACLKLLQRRPRNSAPFCPGLPAGASAAVSSVAAQKSNYCCVSVKVLRRRPAWSHDPNLAPVLNSASDSEPSNLHFKNADTWGHSGTACDNFCFRVTATHFCFFHWNDSTIFKTMVPKKHTFSSHNPKHPATSPR